MKTYLVTYDLNKEGAAYKKASEEVVKAIQAAGEALHCLTTTWIVKSPSSSSAQVYDKIKRFMDDNDNLLVSQMCSDHRGWLSEKACDFISQAPLCKSCA